MENCSKLNVIDASIVLPQSVFYYIQERMYLKQNKHAYYAKNNRRNSGISKCRTNSNGWITKQETMMYLHVHKMQILHVYTVITSVLWYKCTIICQRILILNTHFNSFSQTCQTETHLINPCVLAVDLLSTVFS